MNYGFIQFFIQKKYILLLFWKLQSFGPENLSRENICLSCLKNKKGFNNRGTIRGIMISRLSQISKLYLGWLKSLSKELII